MSKYVPPAIGAGALALLLAFLPVEEGTRYTPYLDPVGVPTVCSGHTGNVVWGKTYTKAECEVLLRQDIDNAWKVVSYNVPAEVIADMHPKTKAMFTSFVFHYGPGGKGVKDGFVYLKSGKNSTMIRKLKAGDVSGACREFPKWNANKLPGIIKRNLKSEALCLEGVREQELLKGKPPNAF